MSSCNDNGVYQTDKQYKKTFKYVAPGPCGNNIGQHKDTLCTKKTETDTTTDIIDGYKQRCTVVYQLPGIAWNGNCGSVQGASLNNDCYSPQAFCAINKGQRAKDIIPLEDLTILSDGIFKDKIITDNIWNRIYEILLTIFNFPIPINTKDTSRRGTRNPYIYELVKCTEGNKEKLGLSYPIWKDGPQGDKPECYQIYIEGKGYFSGMWRYKEKIPKYTTIQNKISNSNGQLTLVLQTNKNKAELPRFRNFKDSDIDNWDTLVSDQKVYIRHNIIVDNQNNIKGVKDGNEILTRLFNEILGTMDLNSITSNVKITQELMQDLQFNILNYELDPSRCRSCNTYCNANPCETTTWQTATEKCNEGGGCSAIYGCMCYFQGVQTTCWQPGCGMVCPGMV